MAEMGNIRVGFDIDPLQRAQTAQDVDLMAATHLFAAAYMTERGMFREDINDVVCQSVRIVRALRAELERTEDTR